MSLTFYDLTEDYSFVPKGKKKEDEFQYLTGLWEASLPPLPSENIGQPMLASESPLPWQEEIASDPYADLGWNAPQLPEQGYGDYAGFDDSALSWMTPEQQQAQALSGWNMGQEQAGPWEPDAAAQYAGLGQDVFQALTPGQGDEARYEDWASTDWETPRVGRYALDDPQTYGELLGDQSRPVWEDLDNGARLAQQFAAASGKWENRTYDSPLEFLGAKASGEAPDGGSQWGRFGTTLGEIATAPREYGVAPVLGNVIEQFEDTSPEGIARLLAYQGLGGGIPGLGNVVAGAAESMTPGGYGEGRKRDEEMATALGEKYGPGGRILYEGATDPVNWIAPGMVGGALKGTKLASLIEAPPLASALGVTGAAAGAEYGVPLVPDALDPLVAGAGAALLGPSAARAIGRGVKVSVDDIARLDAKINEPAGAMGSVAAGMSVPKKPRAPLESLPGDLQAPLVNAAEEMGMSLDDAAKIIAAAPDEFAKVVDEAGGRTTAGMDLPEPRPVTPEAPVVRAEPPVPTVAADLPDGPVAARVADIETRAERGDATPAEVAASNSAKKAARARKSAGPEEAARARREANEDIARVIVDDASGGGKKPPRKPRVSQTPEPPPPDHDANLLRALDAHAGRTGEAADQLRQMHGRQFAAGRALTEEADRLVEQGQLVAGSPEYFAFIAAGGKGGVAPSGLEPISADDAIALGIKAKIAYGEGRINDPEFQFEVGRLQQNLTSPNPRVVGRELELFRRIMGIESPAAATPESVVAKAGGHAEAVKRVDELMDGGGVSSEKGVSQPRLGVVNPEGVVPVVTDAPAVAYKKAQDDWRAAAKVANEAELAARAPDATDVMKRQAAQARELADAAKRRLDMAAAQRDAYRVERDAPTAKDPTPEDIEKAAKNWGIKLARTGYSVTVETLLGTKAIKASLDISAMLRQGALAGGAHPKIAAAAFKKQIEAMGSTGAYLDQLDDLVNSHNHSWHEVGDLDITDAKKILKGEEQFAAHWVEKIPGLGQLVSASSRAYSSFLNYTRVHVFDTVWDNLPDEAKTVERAKALAGLINAATGRGTLPKALGANNQILNAIFFAPRYIVSRPEFIARGVNLAVRDKYLRVEALKQLVGYFAATGTIMGLGMAAYEASDGKAGWQVDLNPKSGQFGNMKMGPVSYDPWAGFSQIAKMVIQASTAEKYSSNSGTNRSLGRMFGQPFLPSKEPIERFARGKLSPAGGLAWSLNTGRDFDGNKIDTHPLNLLADLAAPLSFAEMLKAWKEYDLGRALMTLPGFLGTGVNVQSKDNYEIASKAAYEEFDPAKDAGVDYEKPKRAYWDPLFKRLFNEKNPDIEPEVRGERAEASRALIKEYEVKQAENTRQFAADEINVGQWKDWRSTLSYAKVQEREQILKDFVGADPPKDTPAYWVKTYTDTFVRLPDDKVDRDATRVKQDEWIKEHGPTALAYVNAFYAADKTPEDKAYITAMQKLASDGVFDRAKLPRYIGLTSGMKEEDLEKLVDLVGIKRNENDTAERLYGDMDWEKSAMRILIKEGYSAAEAQDVVRVHNAQNAMEARAEGNNMAKDGARHVNWKYYDYRQAHPKEFAWLKDDYSYQQILDIYGGSWSE